MLDTYCDLAPSVSETLALADDLNATGPRGEPPAARTDPSIHRWLAAALDELDYGIVVVGPSGRVLHLNDAATHGLDRQHALVLQDGFVLRPRRSRDFDAFRDALDAAANHGLRRLLELGEGPANTTIAVVPLENNGVAGRRAVLVVFAKRTVSETLSIEGYARGHGLSGAETRVLVALCAGMRPIEAAGHLGVAISTVRSHIGSIRAKTGATSIRSLVSQVALLPPVKGVLGRGAAFTPPLDMFIK